MAREKNPKDRLAELAELARFFSECGRDEEAAALYTVALEIAPADEELKQGLTEVRQRQRDAGPAAHQTVLGRVQEQLRRRSIDGAHFLGLARLYQERGDSAQALECLEIAKSRDPANPAHHKLHGRILLSLDDAPGAVRELAQALRLDPFDPEAAELLTAAEEARGETKAALQAAVHGYLLIEDRGSDEGKRLGGKIKELLKDLGWQREDLSFLLRRRTDLLETAYDRLEWRRERLVTEDGRPTGGAFFGASPKTLRGGRLEIASRLRRTAVLAPFSDDQIFRLSEAVQEEGHDTGSVVLAHGTHGRDLFFLEEGTVRIERPTPYGVFKLADLAPGALFGEIGFISNDKRTGDAIAARPSRLLRFDAEALDQVLGRDPSLAAHLYWVLWHGLAEKLRRTNEQLRGIFSETAVPENFLRLRRVQEGESARATVTSSEKVRLFREQGLSRGELATFADFAVEKRYPTGAFLFQEGDPGDTLYVVADGHVLISKFIPGGGDEALAVLGRGDFFGEMALIDGQPRSADAQALGGPLTVLSLDSKQVREILGLDSLAALEFLQLLCRLMAQRLKEIDEKVIGWRIFSRHQGHDLSAPGSA